MTVSGLVLFGGKQKILRTSSLIRKMGATKGIVTFVTLFKRYGTFRKYTWSSITKKKCIEQIILSLLSGLIASLGAGCYAWWCILNDYLVVVRRSKVPKTRVVVSWLHDKSVPLFILLNAVERQPLLLKSVATTKRLRVTTCIWLFWYFLQALDCSYV